jgi:translation elongation factor EF-1alpha
VPISGFVVDVMLDESSNFGVYSGGPLLETLHTVLPPRRRLDGPL